MKRVLRLGAGLAVLFAIGACSDSPVGVPDHATDVAITTNYDTFGAGDPIDLVAGQFTVVGNVVLSGDPSVNGDFTITYNITEPGWCLTVTHWHVADTEEGIPQNKKGNPKIGHFMGGEEDIGCTTSASYTLMTGISGSAPWAVAAHAEVGYSDDAGAVTGDILFGIMDGPNRDEDGDLYAIDPVSGTLTLLADLDDMAPNDNFSPNGLATDAVNERLYFSVSKNGNENVNDSDLYYYDLNAGGAPVMAGADISSAIYSATFMDGKYYFVDNLTDNLWEVTFDASGVNGVAAPKCVGFWNTGSTVSLEFGDIAVHSGVVYGVARISGGDVYYFSVNLGDCAFNSWNKTTDGDGGYNFLLQLAFSSQGNLYAQRALSAGGSGEWFELNPADGDIIQYLFMPEVSFTDVSAGVIFEEPEYGYETAWGLGGNPFVTNGGSWAEWFEYNPGL